MKLKKKRFVKIVKTLNFFVCQMAERKANWNMLFEGNILKTRRFRRRIQTSLKLEDGVGGGNFSGPLGNEGGVQTIFCPLDLQI